MLSFNTRQCTKEEGEEEETAEDEEERSLIKDLKRNARLAVARDRHGSLVPRWT